MTAIRAVRKGGEYHVVFPDDECQFSSTPTPTFLFHTVILDLGLESTYHVQHDDTHNDLA
ncbi:MAG: hypothetical protein NC133_03540 [Prevotella sp.]|nr:hypothetical protein [Prevotella sp.]